VDIFEGIDPRQRSQAFERSGDIKYFPSANVFESCNSIQMLYYIVWEVSKNEVLVETLEVPQFESFQNLKPKLLWLKGSYKYNNNNNLRAALSSNAFFSSINDEEKLINNRTIVEEQQRREEKNDVIDLYTNNDDDINNNFNDNNIINNSVNYSNYCGIPQNRVESEFIMAAHLDVLYDQPLVYAYREISIGEQTKNVHAFHYPAENIIAPRNNSQKREYIDEQEETILYRWELKAVLCCKLFYKVFTNKLLSLIKINLSLLIYFCLTNRRRRVTLKARYKEYIIQCAI
jgi:hypothetical protein